MMPRLIGIDIGTTACKAVLIDETGTIRKTCSVDYPIYTPEPGWTEQNPEEWWNAATACVAQLGESDAIGLTGQMHGSVFLDADNRVIRPALLWNDQRTASEVREMERTLGLESIYATTCNPPLSGFQAPKIVWLRNNEPANYGRLKSVLLPKDYVRFKLTDEKKTDMSDASGTGVFDVPNRCWATALIERLDIDPAVFPPAVESYELPGAGDQAAGAVGVGSVDPSIASMSLGTSGVLFASQDDATYDPTGRVHTFCHANGAWHSMGVMLSCGGALRWVRDVIGFRDYEEMSLMAARATPSSATFYPYLTGERTPHNDPSLRAGFTGLSLADGKPEFARAAFEGVTLGLLDGFRALGALRAAPIESLRATGGGARSDFWLQLVADAFGVRVIRAEPDEGPAFGAALLAGVTAGVWATVGEACQSTVRLGREFVPDPGRHEDLTTRYRTWTRVPDRME